MILLRDYQQKAVDELMADSAELLKMPQSRHKMVLKAPTGSGKTVMMAAYLNRLCEELPDLLDVPKRQAAFIWLAPHQLHLQSYESIKGYFSELRSIKPIHFEDVSDSRLKPNEVLFVNWQSVNKESNVYVRENEADKTLITYVNNARLHDTEVIVILDEAHLFASKGKAAQKLLQAIYAKIEIDVSATPLFESDYGHVVRRHEVVAAEMIKKGVVLNPNLDAKKQDGDALDIYLLKEALSKREQIAKAYQAEGVGIKPLLLIQLPNDSQQETRKDGIVKDLVLQNLEALGITTQNHKLAIWLSKEKTNLDGIEAYDSITEVLLFKQAISLGWDCPRAAVLLIYREIKQETFTIQTVGRILRMPEQKHYANNLLNEGVVYTNLSKDMIEIVKEDMDYMVHHQAYRTKDYQALQLESAHINTRITRNRLSSRFRKECFYRAAESMLQVSLDPDKLGSQAPAFYNRERLAEKMIETDVAKIKITVPKDVALTGELGVTQVEQTEHFAKTTAELSAALRKFSRANVGRYAKVDSAPVLELALKVFLEDYLLLDEFSSTKIILHAPNQEKWAAVINHALELHEKLLQQEAAKSAKDTDAEPWEVPVSRLFNDLYVERKVSGSVIQPFFEAKNASEPEKAFVSFLEKHLDKIEWWYKNGDKNKEDFAVSYQDQQGVTRGFYVDFVIKLKDGTICLFDTKTAGSDRSFCEKHNALIAYIERNSSETKPIIGGVIVPKGHTEDDRIWKYCPNRITDPNDTRGWLTFNPALI